MVKSLKNVRACVRLSQVSKEVRINWKVPASKTCIAYEFVVTE